MCDKHVVVIDVVIASNDLASGFGCERTALITRRSEVGRQDLFSPFNAFGLGANLVGIGFSKPLAMRFGKRNVFLVGLLLTAIVTTAFMFFPPGAITWMFVAETVRMFIYGTTIPLLWAMMADVADYSEWVTFRRTTGITFSAIVFGLKGGLGFGGAISGWLLSHYGYVANVAQSTRALDGIRLTSSVYAAIPFFLAVGCLCFYKINKHLNIQISHELAERRRKLRTVPQSIIATDVLLPEMP